MSYEQFQIDFKPLQNGEYSTNSLNTLLLYIIQIARVIAIEKQKKTQNETKHKKKKRNKTKRN